ncbi:MAG: hypothetical protein ACRC2H_01170 [Silanimonas sp.]
MKLPNAEKHDTRLWYTRSIIESAMKIHGLSQSALASRIGISRRRLQYLLAGGASRKDAHGSRYITKVVITYPEQYAIEALTKK